jgi:hypothetical protein
MTKGTMMEGKERIRSDVCFGIFHILTSVMTNLASVMRILMATNVVREHHSRD